MNIEKMYVKQSRIFEKIAKDFKTEEGKKALINGTDQCHNNNSHPIFFMSFVLNIAAKDLALYLKRNPDADETETRARMDLLKAAADEIGKDGDAIEAAGIKITGAVSDEYVNLFGSFEDDDSHIRFAEKTEQIESNDHWRYN